MFGFKILLWDLKGALFSRKILNLCTAKLCILRGVKIWRIMLELWHLKSQSGGFLKCRGKFSRFKRGQSAVIDVYFTLFLLYASNSRHILKFLWMLAYPSSCRFWSRHHSVDSLRSSDTYMRRWSNQNGMSPGRNRAIIWTNAGILLIVSLENILQWNFDTNSNIFIQKNVSECVVCEITAIFSFPMC